MTTQATELEAARKRAVSSRMLSFIVFLFAVTVGSLLVSASWFETGGVPWLKASALLVPLVAAERLILRYRYRGQVDAINLFEAALAPAIVTLPIAPLAVVVALAQLITALTWRDAPIKTAFNVAQWTAAAVVGSIMFKELAAGPGLSARNALVLMVAITAVAVTNILTFTYAMHLVQNQPIRLVLHEFSGALPAQVGIWFLNLAFGFFFTAAFLWNAMSALLFLVPLVLLHIASKGYATALVDQERLAGMHSASQILADPVDPRDAIPAFLEEIRRTFSCEVADLVLVDNQTRHLYRARAGATPVHSTEPAVTTFPSLASLLMERAQTTRVTAQTGDPALAAALEQSGFRDCLAAPLVDGDRIVGALCTYNRVGMEGFDEGEATILEALAGEAARAMVKSELLETIIEERQKLADIVGRTSDGILTLTADGQIGTWNFAFERITGYTAAEMSGKTLCDLDVRDANGNRVPLGEWAGIEEALPADVQVTTRSGEVRWLSCSYTRVAEADAKPTILIVVARDATEAREIERLKDDFVATVSHELRTPLTPIKGWAATLLQLGDRLGEPQREEGIRAILRHSERLERLITNILEVTKIERGLSDRRDALVDVAAIVQKVVEDFRGANPTREIRFTTTGSDLKTRGDELWTEQIVSNLVSNALKYAPPPEPVDISIAEIDSRVVISVTDRGPGIPVDETERIFERFKRLGDHMTRTTSGTGLGLYIARQLANAIGGELAVDSKPGHGSTFTLTVPSAQAVDLLHVAS